MAAEENILVQDKVLKAFQEMREDDFTKNILVQLFGAIGYFDVHFSGGVYEEGKDLIAVKEDPFGGFELAVCQSKRYKGNRNKTDRQMFDDSVYQLRQCFSRKIFYKDGREYLPRDVFFVTPYVLEVRLIQEQFEALIPGDKKVRVIDGGRLYSLINDYCPHVIKEFSGLDVRINHDQPEDLLNTELFSALNISNDIDYSSFYNDLNFFVGTIDSNVLLNSIVGFLDVDVPISGDDWKGVSEVLAKANSKAGFNLLTNGIDSIETNYQKSLKKYTSDANKRRIKTKNDLVGEFSGLVENITERLTSISSAMNKFESSNSDSAIDEGQGGEKIVNSLIALIKSSMNDVSASSLNQENITCVVEEIEEGLSSGDNVKFKKDFELVVELLEKIVKISSSINSLSESISPPPYRWIKFNACINEKWFSDEAVWYSNSIKTINSSSSSVSEVREFMDRVERLLYVLDLLISKNDVVAKGVCIKRRSNNNDRLNISAHSIFDSGENVAVYGEAGAGKTTTLQMYAKKYKDKAFDNELILYLPLNRVSIRYKEEPKNLRATDDDLNKLYTAILLYKGVIPSKSNIKEFENYLLSMSKVVFIFDALDEAVKEISWILKGISLLKAKFECLQIIVSTRDCVNYIDDIDFIGITLLPFTEDQLEKFIVGWIKDKNKSDILIEEVRSKKLFDVAKNPLLATIICSLYENEIDVPESEADVYRKKIHLLCGQYDRYKGITRVETPSDVLSDACRKIAFSLHSKNRREANLDEIKEFLTHESGGKYSKRLVNQIVDELINPCNIIQKDPDTGMYGFGHLRYQEYLASEELAKNRGLDIVPLLNNDWWRGVMYLYAFENQIDMLVEEAYKAFGYVYTCENTFRVMISARPKRERKALSEILDGFIKSDGFDGYSIDDYDGDIDLIDENYFM